MKLRRDIFQAIADPTRRRILVLLASQSMTAGAIAAEFTTARPTVSKHIQILTTCDLLRQETSGREITYHINAKKMKVLAEWLLPFAHLWDERFDLLEKTMKTYMDKEKNGIQKRSVKISNKKAGI